LPGALSWICGAPGATAALGQGHGGQGIDVEHDRLGGVARLQRVSAMTQATASPTKRTLSPVSAGRGGTRIGEPSRFGKLAPA
jgi:hypothetical protein